MALVTGPYLWSKVTDCKKGKFVKAKKLKTATPNEQILVPETAQENIYTVAKAMLMLIAWKAYWNLLFVVQIA